MKKKSLLERFRGWLHDHSLSRIDCAFTGHAPNKETRIEDGDMSNGYGHVRIRVQIVTCGRCGRTLDLQPCGIVHDAQEDNFGVEQ